MSRTTLIAGGAVVLALGLGGASLGVTLSRPTPPTTNQVTALTARVRTLETGLAQANQNEQSNAVQNNTTQLDLKIAGITACLPEMEAQLVDASVSGSYVSDPTIIVGQSTQLAEYPQSLSLGPQLSQDCQSLLEPAR